MEIVRYYKIPKDQEIHRITRSKGFKFISDTGRDSLNFSLFLNYFIELIEKGSGLPIQIIRTW